MKQLVQLIIKYVNGGKRIRKRRDEKYILNIYVKFNK
jgi:hypothetical protein